MSEIKITQAMAEDVSTIGDIAYQVAQIHYQQTDDLWNNRKDLREQNLEKVLAYKDVLTKRVNAYLMTHQQNIK